ADSREGQLKEGEITRQAPRDTPTQGRLRQGFVYKRVPHITLKSIANNAEIDTIWEEYQEKLEPLREEINQLRGRDGSNPDLPPFEEWTMPREPGSPWPEDAAKSLENLFTVFGEPDIVVHDEGEGNLSIEVIGVDMYKGGQIESGDADDIAVWFIDTDYNYESFFVRHAYFPGANDPYKALKTTLKAEVDQEAWDSLNRTRSRVFARPKDGRVAVKVVNHLGDEVMKVLEV
ncbi:MAG: hypothetical protein ACR2O7_01325, partial [Parasphingorhabdus sp.]